MTKSNGIKSLKQAAKLLNKHAPDGESLAYINPTEARILKAHGGSGIETLSGVPSYLPEWMTNIWDSYIEPAAEWLGYKGDQGGSRLLKDVTSLGGGYVGWQEAKELSEFQKKQYEKQLAEEALNEIWFAQQTDEGAPLKAPTNVPSTIEDVSVFSEATGIPTLKTTAAQGGRIGFNSGGQGDRYSYLIDKVNKGIPLTPPEAKELQMLEITYADVDRDPSAQGGRIGAFNGGIQGLMPQQGFMPQPGLMPQQGLNPRMGYQGGMTVEEMGVDYSNPNEMITSKEAWLGDKQFM